MRAIYADGCLRFEVQDTGPGIALAAFESLFNRFSNASLDAKWASRGARLGLAVSHRLVSLFNRPTNWGQFNHAAFYIGVNKANYSILALLRSSS